MQKDTALARLVVLSTVPIYADRFKEDLYKLRIEARKNKDFAYADQLRLLLEAIGYDVLGEDDRRNPPRQDAETYMKNKEKTY